MEEFQEAEILWPVSADDHHHDHIDGIDTTTTLPSVRSKPASPELSAPVEISRRKRRCRPWAASEFDQEIDGTVGEEDDPGCADDAKQRSARGLTSVVVPPHVLLARRRMLGGRTTAAYSMCAGKGRTLKGRDLRDVRNLVLKLTGFIEK